MLKSIRKEEHDANVSFFPNENCTDIELIMYRTWIKH